MAFVHRRTVIAFTVPDKMRRALRSCPVFYVQGVFYERNTQFYPGRYFLPPDPVCAAGAGAVGVRLVLSFVISRRTSELFPISLATPASFLVQILLCGAFFVYTLRKEKQQVTL